MQASKLVKILAFILTCHNALAFDKAIILAIEHSQVSILKELLTNKVLGSDREHYANLAHGVYKQKRMKWKCVYLKPIPRSIVNDSAGLTLGVISIPLIMCVIGVPLLVLSHRILSRTPPERLAKIKKAKKECADALEIKKILDFHEDEVAGSEVV